MKWCRQILAISGLLLLPSMAAPVPVPAPAAAAITPLMAFRSTDEEPDSIAFTPDGTQLLSASGVELLLWDVASGLPLRRLILPDIFRDFIVCAFSPDGSKVVAASNDGKVATWDAMTGKLLKVFPSQDWMYGCAFTPDRRHVLAVYQSGHVTFRDMDAGQIIWENQTLGVNRCTISGDGKRAVLGTENGIVVLETATGKTLRSFDHHGGGSHFNITTLSPDGKMIACRKDDLATDFQIVDARSGKTLRNFRGHTKILCSLSFSPDGTWIASGSSDNTLKLWDTRTGALIRTFVGHLDDISCSAFFPDGSKVLTASKDLSLKLWDCRRETIPPSELVTIRARQSRLDEIDRANGFVDPLMTFIPTGSKYKFGVEDSGFSPDGKSIISCRDFEPVRIQEISTGQILREFSDIPKDDHVTSCTFSPDGQTALVTVFQEQVVRLWDPQTGKTIRTLQGHESVVTDAAFSPDGSRIVSSSWDKTVRIWSVATGDCLVVIRKHRDDVNHCAFLPDGKAVVTISKDKTVRIFSVADGTPLRTFEMGYEVTTLAISPDGRSIYTCSSNASNAANQTVWDLGTGKAILVEGIANDLLYEWATRICDFIGFSHLDKEYVHCAAFSPDGKWLATGALDQSIRIRDVATGKLVLRVRSRAGHSDSIETISFSPDGTQLLSGSDDGSMKLWNFQQLLDSRCIAP